MSVSDADNNTIEGTADRAPGVVERLGRRGLLVVLSPNLFGASCLIVKPSTVVGRASECDFVLNDPLLSRTHCLVGADENGNFVLEDLHSKNGTFLNSRKVQERVPLHYGDRIVIGDTIVRLLIEEAVDR
jgi:pSer/pThr/pTyr-binding forkhead associated (FHA) protein